MNYLKELCYKILIYIGIYVVITIFWRLLEVKMYGAIQQREVDSLICAIFSLSVLKNIKFGGKSNE